MSNSKPELVIPIENYGIQLFHELPGTYKMVKSIKLRLNKVGGAHVTNPEDLIKQIEDAVFLNEE